MKLRLGLRAQLLIGLCALTLVAVLSAGLLSLLVARRSPAVHGEATAILLGLGLLDGGLIWLVGALLIGRLVVRPLRELRRAAEQHARGDTSARAREDAVGELGSLGASFNRMVDTLEHRVAEYEARTAELDASRVQLQRADRLASLGRLAAGLAHEIGNPLGAMLGYVEILRQSGEGLTPEESKDLLERLHREIERIHRIMQDLLAYSRPPPERVLPTDVCEVIQAALELMRPQSRFRQVSLTSEIPDGLPLVTASPGRLTQVLVNLLLNAADAVAGNGEVGVRARRDGESVLIEIRDSGPGVPESDRERIFDPFFTTKAPGQGTGLGLSTSLGLCETFGATLTLRASPPGRGATFVVTLKVAEDEAGSAPPEH
jgi:two-component system, NtrC family, sensor kinase